MRVKAQPHPARAPIHPPPAHIVDAAKVCNGGSSNRVECARLLHSSCASCMWRRRWLGRRLRHIIPTPTPQCLPPMLLPHTVASLGLWTTLPTTTPFGRSQHSLRARSSCVCRRLCRRRTLRCIHQPHSKASSRIRPSCLRSLYPTHRPSRSTPLAMSPVPSVSRRECVGVRVVL